VVEASVLNRKASARSVEASQSQRALRLLVLTPKPRGLSPGQRFRLEQWAPHVEARHGIRLDFLPFESPRLTKVLYERGHFPEKALLTLWDFARRAAAVVRAQRYDGVIVYREAALLGPAIYERLLAWTQTPLFFDFDDAIWLPTQLSANGIFAKLHFWGKTATTARLSSAVLVGNEHLASWARAHNDNVFVIPTSIDLDRYPVQPELADEESFVVGWSGSLHTLPHFEHARPALTRLAKLRRLTVTVICNRPPERPIDGAKNVFIPWREAGEAENIGRVHVGIMPLPDDEFARGKCGLKALQFMATGRPVVISPVGMNRDLVQHGENGFLASSVNEWVTALERLAGSADLRRQIGAAGRRTIETGYGAEVVADRFAGALRKTLEGIR
jgi:glycosyltransferase involved in cell wall biosynthesis